MQNRRNRAISARSRRIYISIAALMGLVCIAVFSLILALGRSHDEEVYLKMMVADLGMLFATILYICCCFNLRENTWQGHTFTAVSALLFVNILLSGICDILNGTPGTERTITVLQTITNALCMWIHVLFWHYQCTSLPKNRTRRVFTALIYGIVGLYLSVLAINLFNHFLFYVDADGHLIYGGEVFEFAVAIMFYTIYLLYILPQPCPWHKKLSLASFAIFPLISIVLLTVWYHSGIAYSILSVTYIFLLLATYVVFFGDYIENQELLIRQKAELTELQTALTLSQVRPHFLFNSLTAIRSLCKYDPAAAYTALGSFADYLRGNMESLGSERIIPFTKELEHCKTYLMLEQMRFGNDLRVEYDIQYQDFSLPALTVQPIVENAVRHGAIMNESNGVVRICSKKLAGCVCITVWDNGPGFDPALPPADGKSHFGLTNVRSSLAANDIGDLRIESSPAAGTTVTIFIREESA